MTTKKKKEKIHLENQTDVFIVRTSISPGLPINVYYSSMWALWDQDTSLADLLSSEGPWPVEKPFYLEDHGGYEMTIWITKERPYGLPADIVPTDDEGNFVEPRVEIKQKFEKVPGTEETSVKVLVPTETETKEYLLKELLDKEGREKGWLERSEVESKVGKEFTDNNIYRLAAETGNALDEEPEGWHVYGAD